jgi:hypothetical protein
MPLICGLKLKIKMTKDIGRRTNVFAEANKSKCSYEN